jgi:hypothetical protein
MGSVANEDLRAQGRPHHERRAQEVAVRKSRVGYDTAPGDAQYTSLSGQRSGLFAAAFLPQVQQAQKAGGTILIDVHSPQEFSGEILAPPGLPETSSAAVIFRARTVSRGARRATTTERSSRSKIFRSYMAPREVSQSTQVVALLPDRRVVEPHLVRAEVFAGRRQRH